MCLILLADDSPHAQRMGERILREEGYEVVSVTDGDVEQLTGSHVEFKHESDELLRPTGKIAAGGNFTVETLHSGKVSPGAPEGNYKARIVLADEGDAGAPKRKGDPIHKRFLSFETSGLLFTVPGGEYNVTVSRK